MTRYILSVKEIRTYQYLIDAESHDEAMRIFRSYTPSERTQNYLDFESNWASVYETTELVTCEDENLDGFMCPNCDDPNNGARCLRGYCAECLTWLDMEPAPWGTLCDSCLPE